MKSTTVPSCVATAAVFLAMAGAPMPAAAQTQAEQPVSTVHLRTGPAYPAERNDWSMGGSAVVPGGWSSIKLLDINRDGYADLCGVYGPVPSLGNARIYGCVLNVAQPTNEDPNARSFGGNLIRASAFDGNDDPSIHSTIDVVDMLSVGSGIQRRLCGRTAEGIKCQRFDPGNPSLNPPAPPSFTSPVLMQASFTNAAGWDRPEYFSSISFVQINGLPTLCARGIGGVICFPKHAHLTGFTASATWVQSSYSDANGWAQDRYFKTLRFVDMNLDGHADVCGRGAAGIWCAPWSPQQQHFEAPTRWTPQYADAHGWNQAKHFETIRYADVNGDGFVDVCGRGHSGLICELGTGTHFVSAGVINQASLDDYSGWANPTPLRSITLLPVNGDARFDVCGLNTQPNSTTPQWLCALALPWIVHRWEPARFEASLTVRTGDVNVVTELPVHGRLHHGGKTGICWPIAGAVRCSNPWQ